MCLLINFCSFSFFSCLFTVLRVSTDNDGDDDDGEGDDYDNDDENDDDDYYDDGLHIKYSLAQSNLPVAQIISACSSKFGSYYLLQL